LRTGTARLQRGQANRVASIRSKAGFRGAAIALQTITTDANNGKVKQHSALGGCFEKITETTSHRAQMTGSSII
jgi:hypothetical protein